MVGHAHHLPLEALQRRLDFLLSDAAVTCQRSLHLIGSCVIRMCQVKQQLAAPLRPGLSPYFVEFQCWSRLSALRKRLPSFHAEVVSRQLREIRRVYRAQYLQKLAEAWRVG